MGGRMKNTSNNKSRKTAPKSNDEAAFISLLTYSPHELVAGNLIAESLGDKVSENGEHWLAFESEEVRRLDARWRIRSAAFTSAMVGVLGELTGYDLTGNGLTLEEFRNPVERAKLDQSLTPFGVGDSGFLDSDDLLRECWEVVVEMAEEFHAQSPLVRIAKKARAGTNGSAASILNRYGFASSDSDPVKASAIIVRPGVVRAIDAARTLRKRGEFKPSGPVSRLLDVLIKRDLAILPEQEFEKMASDWTNDELRKIHDGFGEAFLNVIADGDLALLDGAKSLASNLIDLLPTRVRSASAYKFKLDEIPNAIDRLKNLSAVGYLEEAKKDREKKARPEIDAWSKTAADAANVAAAVRFTELHLELLSKKGTEKLKAISSEKYSSEEASTYEPYHDDIRKILVQIENEFVAANEAARTASKKSGKYERRGGYQAPNPDALDPTLVDWVKILEDEIARWNRLDGRMTFSKFRDLVGDFVFLLSEISFGFIGSADYQRIENRYPGKLYRRVGPVLKDLAQNIRDIRDGKAGDQQPPKFVPCNDLLMLDAIRRSWTDRQLELEHSHFMQGGTLRNPLLATSMAQ